MWVSPDGKSFAARRRIVEARTLTFTRVEGVLLDRETNSRWNEDGLCTEGDYAGTRLKVIESHQEFWHAWRTFHPDTEPR